MKLSIRLVILGLVLVNGMAQVSADVIIDGQNILEADISEISIDPISGDVTVVAGGLYTVTRDGGGGGGPTVSMGPLVASDTSILEGESVTISWTTTDADSCSPSNGGGGWTGQSIALPDGSSDALTLATAGSYTFTLTCSNDTPSTTARSVTVQVDEDAPPPEPTGDCPAEYVPPLSGNTVTWATFFGTTWPNPAYAQVLTSVRTAGYLAIAFATGSIVEDGGITTIRHTSTYGNRFGAISKCAGDFSEHLPNNDDNFCTRNWYIGGSLKWNSEPATT
ncbi:MAG: hypothetical protein ACR2QG_00720, partial [Gammaproteobacteria bacterium]